MALPRILYTQSLIDEYGSRHMYEVIPLLMKNFEVHVLSGNHQTWEDYKNIPGLIIHTSPSMYKELHPLKDLQAIWECYNIIKKGRYSLIHTHHSKASLITRIAAWMARVPLIIYGLRGVVFNDPMSKFKRLFYIYLEKTSIWMNNFVIPVSQDCITEYHKAGLAKNIPYEIVYSAIDIEAFDKRAHKDTNIRASIRRQYGFDEHDIVFINIGRFSMAKGQRYTIEAFSNILQQCPNAKLLLVGDGEELSACKKQVEEAKMTDKILFTGPANNVPELLAACDVFVLTSLREGLPRVVIEASICELPTVSFVVEGIYEALIENETGYIVPKYDIDALSTKMALLYHNDDLRLKMGSAARAYVISRWDKHKVADHLTKIYKRLLNTI